MRPLEFEHDLPWLRRQTPDLVPCRVERRDHHFSLGLGLTSRCNFNCPICYYHAAHEHVAGHDMPLSLLRAILAPLPRLASIVVGLEGEPLCHPRFFEALDSMALHADSLSLVSNGSLLDKKVCKRLAEYPMGAFFLSIDAGDDVLYQCFRKGGDLRSFKKNGAYLAESLGERAGLHSVIFEENLASLAHVPQLAAEMGIRQISLQQLRATRGTASRGVHPAKGERLKEGLDKIIEAAEKKHIVLLFEQRFGNEEIMRHLQHLAKNCGSLRVVPTPRKNCLQIQRYTSILSNGYIFPCCGNYSPHPIIEFSFAGIFNHEYLQRLRFAHAKGNCHLLPCRLCRQGC